MDAGGAGVGKHRRVFMIQSLSFAESLGVSLLGFSIVFFVLVILMAVIRLLRFVMDKLTGEPAMAVAEPVDVFAEPARVPAKGSYGEVKLYDVDDKTAAMIMAVVADETKIPLNELRFISIREKHS